MNRQSDQIARARAAYAQQFTPENIGDSSANAAAQAVRLARQEMHSRMNSDPDALTKPMPEASAIITELGGRLLDEETAISYGLQATEDRQFFSFDDLSLLSLDDSTNTIEPVLFNSDYQLEEDAYGNNPDEVPQELNFDIPDSVASHMETGFDDSDFGLDDNFER